MGTPNMTELDPCPVCMTAPTLPAEGGPADEVIGEDGEIHPRVFVRCSGCGATVGYFTDLGTVVEAVAASMGA